MTHTSLLAVPTAYCSNPLETEGSIGPALNGAGYQTPCSVGMMLGVLLVAGSYDRRWQ